MTTNKPNNNIQWKNNSIIKSMTLTCDRNISPNL